MNCVEAQGELPLFVGGDLESPGRERVERHLESCRVCREALAQAERARSALRAQFERNAASFAEGSERASAWPVLRERLRAEGLIRSSSLPEGLPQMEVTSQPLHAQPVSIKRQTPRLLRVAQLSAAAAVLFVLGTLAGRLGDEAQTTRPDAPRQGTLQPDLVRSDVTPVPVGHVSDSGASPLREVLLSDEASWSNANEFIHQPVLRPFNAFEPSSDGNTASYSLPGRSNGFR